MNEYFQAVISTPMEVIVRPAILDDVPRISELIASNARKGGLLPRSTTNIRASLKNMLVAVLPGADAEAPAWVAGCGSLVPMSTALVELRSLAVDETLRGGGVGQKLVNALVAEARERKFSTIFALTRAMRFFEKCGFATTSKENFPEKVFRDCVSCPMLLNCDEVAMSIELAPDGIVVPARFPTLGNREKLIPVEAVQYMMETEGARGVNIVREPVNKVVLAYSGGLDTACAVPWLRENYGCEVVCFVADVGQGWDFEAIKQRAIHSGASKCIVMDLRNEFAVEYCYPLVQSGAIYENKYLLGASIVRPLMAKHQVEIANQENADAVAHAATGKGNDQVRFELTYMVLNPRLRVIAPWREWNLRGRDDAIAYAQAHNVPMSQTLGAPGGIYSGDHSLWHRSFEGGSLEDPWREPGEELYRQTVSPAEAPDAPEYVEIDFVCGVPKRVNGVALGGADLIITLNAMGARHGVGRTDLVENRLVGMKSHSVYEAPGATILREGHQGIEELTLNRETLHYKQIVALKYADLLYGGQWFTPLRDAIQAFISVTQRDVTGTARIKLYKGSATLVGRQAAYSLYREDLATFNHEDVYNQKDAEGFIRLYGLPMYVKAQVDLSRAATLASPDAKY